MSNVSNPNGPYYGHESAPSYPLQTLPPNAPRSGLIYLRNWVEAYFQQYAVPAHVAQVGLKYRSFQINQAYPGGAQRVVFIPGEFTDGLTPMKARKYGSISRSTRNATSVVNPREIAEWEQPFTLSVWAAPLPGLSSDEEAATGAVEVLLEQTIRACNTVSFGPKSASATVHWGDVTISSPPTEGAFGVELLVGAVLVRPFFDITLEITQAGPVVPPATYK